MKPATVIWSAALAIMTVAANHAADKPSSRDLAGKWEGQVRFGKFEFSLILRVATNEAGGLKTTLDLPEQGQKDFPVNAFLFNPPDVRLEIDGFGTAYNGKVDSSLSRIEGAFEEGPGGRPEPLVFTRSSKPDAPELEKTYTFAQGEKTDIRGHWKGNLEIGPGMQVIAGLNIGRLPDGSFAATLDLPEQGAKGIPAKMITNSTDSVSLEWQLFQAKFQARLKEDGNSLAGDWVQFGNTNDRAFTRVNGPVRILPDNLSFDPDPAQADDVRGYWKGILSTPGGNLRLLVKIGRTPEGNFAGTLASLDQGGQELPASTAAYSASNLKMEWKAIRGKFDGTLSRDGKTLDGKWEQIGNPVPLKLERTTASDANPKS